MRKKKSFTIIEILITMLIMGSMSATIIPRIGDAREETEKTVKKINETRDFTCELGLDDMCTNGGSSSFDKDNSDGVHYNEKAGEIKVCKNEDCITIMDRNLGATTNDINDSNSYGNYYQWGNNYGFKSNETLNTSNESVDCSLNGPLNPFYSNIFIIGSGRYCSSSNNNLRGGINDTTNNDFGGYPVNNPTDRQGPCPDGYHVPSAGERGTLLQYWIADYTGKGNDLTLKGNKPFNSFNDNYATNLFMEELKIPFAGILSVSTDTQYVGSKVYLWSSSQAQNKAATVCFFQINSGTVIPRGVYYGHKTGFPVRCFKN